MTDGSAYTPVANVRVLDTGRTYIPRYKEVRVRLGGFYGVPASGAGAAVVSLDVTASEAGRAFAWATGAARPGLPTSTFRPGSRSVHTLAIKLGKDGFVSIAANVPARMRLAVIGWTPESAGVTPTTSTPLLDGRSTGRTVDGRYQGAGPTAAGTTVTVQVRSRGGIPSTASWVLASVTAFAPSRAGTAWIWPGGTRPVAPLLAWGTGRTTTSLAMVPLSASGTLALSVSSSATVAVEVVGYGVRGPGVAAVRPAQLLTSTATSRTVDRQQEGVGPLAPGSVFRVRVLGRGGVPSSGVKAVVLDVRASGATNPGGLAAYAPGGATSTIAQGATNPSVTTSNLMVVPLGSDGTIALTSTVKTMVAVTVEGFVRKGSLTNSYVDVPATTRFVQPGDLASAVAADEASGLVSYSLKPEADSIAVGHLVVLSPSPGAPSGHVGRVVSVSGGATQDQVVMTPARLEEAVPSANVAYAGPLGAFQTSPLAQTAPYRQVQTLVAAAVPGDTAIGISCNGHLSSLSAKLVLKLYVDMHFSWGGDTRESKLIVTFKLDGGASISLQPGGSCTFEGPVLARWTQPVGPVALNFAMRPYAELGGQLDLAAASYVIDSAMTVGFRTVDGSLEPVNDLQSNNRAEGLKALAAGSVSLELGLKLEALAYGLVGVNIKVGPYVEAAVTRSGWQLSCDLSAAFRVSASAALNLWLLTKLESELARGIFARKSLGSIGCGEVPPPAVITGRLPQAMVGVGYYTPLESSGGVQPNKYTAAGLPPGIVVSGSTLVGEPTTTGSFSVDIAVTDGAGRTASRTLTLVVTQPPETIAPLLGKIAQLPDGTSAYIDLRGGRHRIPDGGTFQCINAQGKAVVTTDSATFNALPPYEDAACVRANTGDIVNVGDAAYEIDGGWTTHHIANAMTYLCRAANGHRVYGQVPRYWLLDLAAGAELYDGCWVPSNAPRKVVRWSDGSSTYIDSRQRSHSIPDGGTYECLVAQSADYGVVVPAIYRPPSDPENARCIKANANDLVAYGPVSYLIGSGYELRSVVDGISYECLAANGSPVFGQVPRYWVDDRAKGDPATYHCWDKSLALGHVVRFSNGESWYVDLRGGRHHVPDGGTYECIKAQRGDYGVEVPEGRLAEMPKYEPAECVRANQGDLVQFGQDAYLVDNGFVRRRIPDGVSFDCLAANGHAVYGQVPRYWLLDLTEGAEAPFHCWNSYAARGHTVRVADRSSFYVDKRGGRHWVPDGGTYQCIDAQVGSYPYVVPAYSIQELPQYENAQCVRAAPGNIIRHNDGDAYILNGDWTRSHIPTPSSFTCFQVEGRALVNGVPRYYVDDLARTTNDAVYPSGHCIIRRPNGTSYFVNNEARKEWIPDTPTWDCEVGRGVPVINAGDAIIDAVAETGWHYCLNKAQLRGKVLRHIDGHDAHYIHGDDTRTWIPDEFTFNCRTWAGTAVADTRWREYITAFRETGWDYCFNLNTFKNRHIVHHPDGDRHFVGGDGRRHWIPANRLDCMNARHGAPATVRWRQYINGIAEGDWAVCGNVLYRNQLMDRGQFLASSNGRYRLWMQTDGNLVLYNSAGTAIWATNRIGRHLKLHDDGCLAEVDYNGSWVWQTSCNRGGDRLVVQDDGNLVLYAGATAVWATNTVGR